MRTLKDTGLSSAPPFLKTPDLDGRIFEILNAEARQSTYGPEIVFTLRVLDDGDNGPWFYNADGDPVLICSWSASETPSRKKYATWFATPGADTLGPCTIEWVQTNAANPFANIVDADWTDGEVSAAQSAPAPALAAPAPRPTVNAARPPETVAVRQARARRAAAAPMPPMRPDDDDDDTQDLPF